MPKQLKVTLADVQKALKSPDVGVRARSLQAFSRSDVTMEAVPTLTAALEDESPDVVGWAATALGRLGPAAAVPSQPYYEVSGVVWALIWAGMKVYPAGNIPQAYQECLAALLKIAPQYPLTLSLIHSQIGMDEFGMLQASLRGLKTIGTPKALDLLKRTVVFWTPELNKRERRVVEKIVAEP